MGEKEDPIQKTQTMMHAKSDRQARSENPRQATMADLDERFFLHHNACAEM